MSSSVTTLGMLMRLLLLGLALPILSLATPSPGSPLPLPSSLTAEDAYRAVQQRLFPALPRSKVPPYRTAIQMLPMRDGVSLYTVAFIPIDAKKTQFDTVMIRTPYGTDGLRSLGETYISNGFAAVMQDFRGRYRSKGQFECWFNASTDAADTISWLIQQPWSTKVVFQTGTSAPGIATYFSEVAEPSPLVLRALYPIVATAELHKSIFQNGAYRYNLIHGWLNGIGEGSFEANFTTHEGESSFWDNVTMTDKWARVTAPAVHLTGWYDIFNQQQLDAYNAYQTQSSIGRGRNYLVVLPTGHCAGGQVAWPLATEGFDFANQLSIALFKALGSPGEEQERATRALANASLVYWYVMGPGLSGTKGNYWTNAPSFPTSTPLTLFLNPGGVLSPSAPSEGGAQSFIYNPTKPLPTLGGNTLGYSSCGPWNQAELEKRSDVLVFTGAPFPTITAITGHMSARLFVTSNCTDTDFTVKVTDVFPNGTSLLVQNGIIRMRWRNGGAAPSLLSPGSVYEVTVDIWSTSYIFNPGHAIRLTVSSSNYPLFSANPNTGRPLTDTTTPPVNANNTVFFGPTTSSYVVLPVVSLDQLPELALPRLDL